MFSFRNIHSVIIQKRNNRTSRLDAADDDVADFIVSDLVVATSIKQILNYIKLFMSRFKRQTRV